LYLLIRFIREDKNKGSKKMTIFPTDILLATHGSEEASLAARTGVDLAYKTGSELHVVNVGLHDFGYPIYAVPEVEQARTIQKEVTQEAHLGMGGPDVEIVKRWTEAGC